MSACPRKRATAMASEDVVACRLPEAVDSEQLTVDSADSSQLESSATEVCGASQELGRRLTTVNFDGEIRSGIQLS